MKNNQRSLRFDVAKVQSGYLVTEQDGFDYRGSQYAFETLETLFDFLRVTFGAFTPGEPKFLNDEQ